LNNYFKLLFIIADHFQFHNPYLGSDAPTTITLIYELIADIRLIIASIGLNVEYILD